MNKRKMLLLSMILNLTMMFWSAGPVTAAETKTGKPNILVIWGMVEHDDHVGLLLDKIDELGIAENTIVIYSTDNGAETLTWPDGGITPFKGEKGTTWEGGFRAPLAVRWPGVIEPGTKNNDIISHEDWMPTLIAAVGDPQVRVNLSVRS